MSCGVGRRHSSDLELLWLWRRPAAVAPIGPLAWELPYAVDMALQRQKDKKRKKEEKGKLTEHSKPAVMEKIKIILKKSKKLENTDNHYT